MKKFLSFMFWAFAALFVIFGISFSDSVLDYLNDVSWDILFGYTPDDVIEVSNIWWNSITIQSPVLQDEFWDIISDYTLMYGEYPLVDVLDDPTLLDYSQEKYFEDLELTNESDFTMSIDMDDNILEDIVYYVVAIPKDDAGTLWEVSNEICFRLEDQIYGEWDDCENVELVDTSSNTHSAWADMQLANVTHILNGRNVTLKWIEIWWSDEIDIFLRDEWAGTFRKLDTVDMDDEMYSFRLDDPGEQIVKFIPNNGWVEKDYVFNAVWTDTPNQPVVTPVVVWPKENIMFIIFGTILIYLVYRLVKRRV